MIDTARTAKVTARKLTRRIDEIASQSNGALHANHLPALETLAHNSAAITAVVVKVARRFSELLTTAQSSKSSMKLGDFLSTSSSLVESELGKRTDDPLGEINRLLSQLANDLQTTLTAALDDASITHRKPSPFRAGDQS